VERLSSLETSFAEFFFVFFVLFVVGFC